MFKTQVNLICELKYREEILFEKGDLFLISSSTSILCTVNAKNQRLRLPEQ